MKLSFSLLPIVLLVCVACGPDRSAQDSATQGSGASTAAPEAEAPAATAPTGPLTFNAQEGWIAETTTSGMRAAQFRLPAQEGDAEVVVFFFGAGGAGGFQANLERWAGMFEQPDGSSSMDRVSESSRHVAGMAVREVSIEGNYSAEVPPGSGNRVRHEDWALRGAMVDAPVGPYFIRLLGPADVVERYEPSFRAFISSLGGR